MPERPFDDRELVAGSLVGVRRFKVDALGRLTGVSVRDVWRPGVNQAVCRGPELQVGDVYTRGPYSGTVTISEAFVEHANTHRVGSKDCPNRLLAGHGCGYYAFFEPDTTGNHGYGAGMLHGIVEATGLASVGAKGFRAEKAEIVALAPLTPPEPPEPESSKALRRYALARWMLGKKAPLWPVALAIVSTVSLFFTGVVLGVVVSPWFFALLAPVPVGPFVVWSSFKEIDMRFPELLTREQRERMGIPERGVRQAAEAPESSVPWDLIKRNYPDVPVYDSLDDALAAHPLSEPPAKPVIAPDTVDDFWTRRAE